MQNPHNDKLSGISCVLLADGRSRLRGRDKARIELGGCSLYKLPLAFLPQHFKTVIIAGDRRPDLARKVRIGGRYKKPEGWR